jgi:hypothetical protein
VVHCSDGLTHQCDPKTTICVELTNPTNKEQTMYMCECLEGFKQNPDSIYTCVQSASYDYSNTTKVHSLDVMIVETALENHAEASEIPQLVAQAEVDAGIAGGKSVTEIIKAAVKGAVSGAKRLQTYNLTEWPDVGDKTVDQVVEYAAAYAAALAVVVHGGSNYAAGEAAFDAANEYEFATSEGEPMHLTPDAYAGAAAEAVAYATLRSGGNVTTAGKFAASAAQAAISFGISSPNAEYVNAAVGASHAALDAGLNEHLVITCATIAAVAAGANAEQVADIDFEANKLAATHDQETDLRMAIHISITSNYGKDVTAHVWPNINGGVRDVDMASRGGNATTSAAGQWSGGTERKGHADTNGCECRGFGEPCTEDSDCIPDHGCVWVGNSGDTERVPKLLDSGRVCSRDGQAPPTVNTSVAPTTAPTKLGFCSNGVLSVEVFETDVDCGGPYCEPCDVHLLCQHNGDCLSNDCSVTTFTCQGTGSPSMQPTPAPSVEPTIEPTNQPTKSPTVTPTSGPTSPPTIAPTALVPTTAPSSAPTYSPTYKPTHGGCNDGTQSADILETDVDCGGPFCEPCAHGQRCHYNTDCKSNICTDIIAMKVALGLLDNATTGVIYSAGNSTAVDGICNTAQPTATPTLAPTPVPTSLTPTATPSTHPTLVPTGEPTTVAPTPVPTGQPTHAPTSLAPSLAPTVTPSLVPTANPTAKPTTAAPTVKPTHGSCADGKQSVDMWETDIDCGGLACPPCKEGQHCTTGTDCTSGVCTAGTCDTARPSASPTYAPTAIPTFSPTFEPTGDPTHQPSSAPTPGTCFDGRHSADRSETDIDCGGYECEPCMLEQICILDSDCEGTLVCDEITTPSVVALGLEVGRCIKAPEKKADDGINEATAQQCQEWAQAGECEQTSVSDKCTETCAEYAKWQHGEGGSASDSGGLAESFVVGSTMAFVGYSSCDDFPQESLLSTLRMATRKRTESGEENSLTSVFDTADSDGGPAIHECAYIESESEAHLEIAIKNNFGSATTARDEANEEISALHELNGDAVSMAEFVANFDSQIVHDKFQIPAGLGLLSVSEIELVTLYDIGSGKGDSSSTDSTEESTEVAPSGLMLDQVAFDLSISGANIESFSDSDTATEMKEVLAVELGVEANEVTFEINSGTSPGALRQRMLTVASADDDDYGAGVVVTVTVTVPAGRGDSCAKKAGGNTFGAQLGSMLEAKGVIKSQNVLIVDESSIKNESIDPCDSQCDKTSTICVAVVGGGDDDESVAADATVIDDDASYGISSSGGSFVAPPSRVLGANGLGAIGLDLTYECACLAGFEPDTADITRCFHNELMAIDSPTLVPSAEPTLAPSEATAPPGTVPTNDTSTSATTTAPTTAPTTTPTTAPTTAPSLAPTKLVTTESTLQPTLQPTLHPSKNPCTKCDTGSTICTEAEESDTVDWDSVWGAGDDDYINSYGDNSYGSDGSYGSGSFDGGSGSFDGGSSYIDLDIYYARAHGTTANFVCKCLDGFEPPSDPYPGEALTHRCTATLAPTFAPTDTPAPTNTPAPTPNMFEVTDTKFDMTLPYSTASFDSGKEKDLMAGLAMITGLDISAVAVEVSSADADDDDEGDRLLRRLRSSRRLRARRLDDFLVATVTLTTPADRAVGLKAAMMNAGFEAALHSALEEQGVLTASDVLVVDKRGLSQTTTNRGPTCVLLAENECEPMSTDCVIIELAYATPAPSTAVSPIEPSTEEAAEPFPSSAGPFPESAGPFPEEEELPSRLLLGAAAGDPCSIASPCALPVVMEGETATMTFCNYIFATAGIHTLIHSYTHTLIHSYTHTLTFHTREPALFKCWWHRRQTRWGGEYRNCSYL